MRRKGHVAWVFLVCFLASSVVAQEPPPAPSPEDIISHQPPYRPTDKQPDPDKYHFPQGSDIDTYKNSLESMKILEDQQHGYGFKVGEFIAEKFGRMGEETYWEREEENEYAEHNWIHAECGYRNIMTSEKTLVKDSLKVLGMWSEGNPQNFEKFYECFEPRFMGFCSQCMPPFWWGPLGSCTGGDCTNMSLSPAELLAMPGLTEDQRAYLTALETLAQVWGGLFNCPLPVQWNIGYTFEYWWPEEEVGTNNFGTSSFSPARDTFGGLVGNLAVYTREELAEFLDAVFRPEALKEFFLKRGVKDAPPDLEIQMKAGEPKEPYKMLGKTHSAGLQPGDQTLTLDAHMFQTLINWTVGELGLRGEGGYAGTIRIPAIQYIPPFTLELVCPSIPFWFNGFERGNPERCVYDLFDEKDQFISGWTEEVEFGPTWRIAELSTNANPLLYFLSAPFQSEEASPQRMIYGKMYVPYRSCGSYRILRWPERYTDLDTAVKATPTSPWFFDPSALLYHGGIQPYLSLGAESQVSAYDLMEDTCYFGGGQLYPIVNNLAGHYPPIPSTNYIARRALELITNPEINKRGYPAPKSSGPTHIPSRPPRYADNKDVDKIQRIWPTDPSRPVDPFGAPEGEAPRYGPTGCYRMNDVDERSQGRFPKNIEEIGGNGDVRYVYWNRRTACICPYRGSSVAWEDTIAGGDPRDRSDDIDKLTPAAYASLAANLQFPVYFPLPKYKGWGCMAGVAPEPSGVGGSGGAQSEADFLIGRGDFFYGENHGEKLPIPFYAWPLLEKYPYLDMRELNAENIIMSTEKIQLMLPLVDVYLAALGVKRDHDAVKYATGAGSAQVLCGSGGAPAPAPIEDIDPDPDDSSSSSSSSSSGRRPPPIIPPPGPGPGGHPW